MKIAIITRKNSSYGLKLFNLLKRENIPVELAVVVKQSLQEKIQSFRSVAKRIGFIETFFELINIYYENYLNSKITIWRKFPLIRKYNELCNKVFYASNPNNEQTQRELINFQPDLILLGQSGIIKDNIIKIPKIGILNSHPGILPQYRGIDVVHWALFNNDIKAIGSTIHFIDSGIDTGPVIYKRNYKFIGNENFNKLEEYIYEDCLDLFVYALRNIKLIKPIKQNISEGKQYYKMPKKIKVELNKRLIKANYFMSKIV